MPWERLAGWEIPVSRARGEHGTAKEQAGATWIKQVMEKILKGLIINKIKQFWGTWAAAASRRRQNHLEKSEKFDKLWGQTKPFQGGRKVSACIPPVISKKA
ncbi:MAG: hypothetical protein QME75_07600 [Deltaproteobacteria bacterium]|nr:hypothetical protein [Deltaproteobacteria bacterium]